MYQRKIAKKTNPPKTKKKKEQPQALAGDALTDMNAAVGTDASPDAPPQGSSSNPTTGADIPPDEPTTASSSKGPKPPPDLPRMRPEESENFLHLAVALNILMATAITESEIDIATQHLFIYLKEFKRVRIYRYILRLVLSLSPTLALR